MRRMYLGLVASALLLVLATAAAWAQPADVPPGHWAYRAVLAMVERGYMDTDPTGAFNGTDPAQRFDVAAAVGRLLEDVESGRIRIASGADTEMLRALEQEFRAELVQWYSERDRLEAAHAQTQRHIAVINEQLGLLLVALDDLQTALQSELRAGLRAEAERTDGRFAQTDGRLDDIEGRLDDADSRLAQTDGRLDGVELRISSLKDDLDLLALDTDARFHDLTGTVDRRVSKLQEAVDAALDQFGRATGAQLDEHGGELAALQGALARLQSAVGEHGEQLENLETGTSNRFADLEAGWFARFAALEAELTAVAEDLVGLAARGEELAADLAAGLAKADEDIRHTQHLMVDFVIELRNELEALRGQTAALQTQIRELVSDLVALRTQMSELQSRVGTLESSVGGLHSDLGGVQTTVGAVQADVGMLQGDVDGLRTDVGALQTELSELHDVMGTSEEQIARMTDRVRVQLEDQLALSLAREQRLERQLTELRTEFESYKTKADEELKSARNMGSLALGAAALAILLGLTSN